MSHLASQHGCMEPLDQPTCIHSARIRVLHVQRVVTHDGEGQMLRRQNRELAPAAGHSNSYRRKSACGRCAAILSLRNAMKSSRETENGECEGHKYRGGTLWQAHSTWL